MPTSQCADPSVPVRRHTVRFLPSGAAATAGCDDTLLSVARRAGLVVDAPCGGEGTCGKCAIRVPPSDRGKVRVEDDGVLTAEDIRGGLVLSCQTRVAGDVEVFLPDAHRSASIRILTDGYAGEVHHSPHIRKRYDGYAHATLVYAGDEVIGTETGDTTEEVYGAAIDIGTTTLVASLLDLSRGAVVATESSLNPQALHAQDVLSRIKAASTDQGLAFLHGMLRDELNVLLGRLASSSGTRLRQVYEVVLSGNTCMLHLVTGAPTASLGKYPYNPAIRGGNSLPSSDVGLRIAPFGQVYLPPIIGPYVGADITSGVVVTQLERRPGLVLFVDIGTNGEIVLSDNSRLLAASTAAGPAFEGMNIRHGMRAAPGAIERFRIDSDMSVHAATIGGQPAVGICGSGLVDVVAELVRVGIVAPNGRMARPSSPGVPSTLQEHLLLLDDKPAFRVAEAIYLTQSDIRHVQLAKGALRTGIEMLLRHAGRSADQVDEVIIAGSFGYHLQVESLARLGLLPADLRDRVHFVGNTSRTGAEAFLLNTASRHHIHQIVSRVKVVELADDATFQSVFVKNMGFG